MTVTYFRDDIPELHLNTLRSSALLLQKDFAGVFGTETIERFLITSYDEFAGRLANATYLPMFAERFARERLTALARIEGRSDDHRPVVLFLCTHNAGRSQIALGFFRALADDRAIAWSGGSEPGSQVNASAVAAMREVGIDISGEFPKPWTDEVVRAADVVVTMGCGDACPIFPGKRYEDWTIEDPNGLAVDDVRPIRDEIKGRVETLLAELGVLVG
jgi:arsenate reductase